MSCSCCDELDLEWAIRSPGELATAIRIARSDLADGTLREVQVGDPSQIQSVRDIAEDGPWPDSIECRFACGACGARYRLAAETYHGAGGRWAPVGPA